jgi:hypothetical protein
MNHSLERLRLACPPPARRPGQCAIRTPQSEMGRSQEPEETTGRGRDAETRGKGRKGDPESANPKSAIRDPKWGEESGVRIPNHSAFRTVQSALGAPSTGNARPGSLSRHGRPVPAGLRSDHVSMLLASKSNDRIHCSRFACRVDAKGQPHDHGEQQDRDGNPPRDKHGPARCN